eukprot:m.158034 g.158034  ORF g.158034 m.158034 type:complete len:92 (-) comp17979_c0_seq8:2604-2879(-)
METKRRRIMAMDSSCQTMGVPAVDAACEVHVVTSHTVPSILWQNTGGKNAHGTPCNKHGSAHEGFLLEIIVKVVLNAMTTGGHVLKERGRL